MQDIAQKATPPLLPVTKVCLQNLVKDLIGFRESTAGQSAFQGHNFNVGGGPAGVVSNWIRLEENQPTSAAAASSSRDAG